MQQAITLTGETITRARIEQLLAEQALLVFDECDFQQAVLSRLDLQDCSFSTCAVAEASFYAANLARTRWRRCRGGQADFEAADLSGCDFREAVFEGGSLRDAHIKDTRFDHADLREADVGGLKLLNARRQSW